MFLRSVRTLFVVLCLLSMVHPAQAHASLLSSQPHSGAALVEAPAEILFEFTEPVDPALAGVTLRDSAGDVVVEGEGIVDETNPERMTFPLPDLANGTYSAVWRVRSTVDGHVTFGTVAFSVGVESPAASLLPPPGTPDPATALPPTLETLFRYATYLSLAVAIGPLLFGLWVWLPLCRSREAVPADSDQRVTHLLRGLAQIGLVMLAAATAGFALTQAVQNSPEWGLTAVFAGRSGLLLGIRLLLAAVLLGIVWRLPPLSRPLPWWGSAAGLAGVLLLTFSLNSHNATLDGVQGVVATVADWVHLLATTAWLGGLLPLALLQRRGRLEAELQRGLVPRFSRVALLAVLALGLTGLYSALVHVQTWEALFATTYGRMLTGKSLLFAVIIALGAVNLLVLSPKLAQTGQQAVGWLRRTVRLEIATGALLLCAVGVLMGVAPAYEALQAQRRQGFAETVSQGGVQLTLRVAPLQVGENEFGVDVVDERPGVETVAREVILRFSDAAGEMGTIQVETEESAASRHTARGPYLAVPGLWEVQVIVRLTGFDDVVHRFLIEVAQ
jgi:copper transport protein